MSLQVAESTQADLRRLAVAYKAAGKDIRKQVLSSLRSVGKPIGAETIAGGSEEMPARGGLRARIEKARPGVTSALTGKTAKVTISLKVREAYDLNALEAGVLRHPVYARGDRKGWKWTKQSVPAHAFSEAFDRQRDEATTKLRTAILASLDNIARS